MPVNPRRALAYSAAVLFILTAAMRLRSNAAYAEQERPAAPAKPNPADAFRFNALGVAYMNQQRPADAQKYFEQSLAADPDFAVARMNLGVALLGQQKLEAARDELAKAAEQLPNDAYAWYNLGLAYKDVGDAEKGIAAFKHVTKVRPDEADAYYFVGYLSTQEQKYDDAIAAFQKGVALNPVHASAEFGLARALQRKGDTAAAREHLARFQKITTEHLGTPFGAGYGDQGKYSLAELPPSTAAEVPAEIHVNFKSDFFPLDAKAGATPVTIGPTTGACFLDFDGDGKPDLFLVSGKADGTSHLLRNLGNGKFEDVTQAAGIHLAGAGLGCAAGDFDNDGKADLAVCLSDGVHMLHNKGEGKFEEVTEKVGIRKEKGCVGVTFVDYDHDGDLDLYMTMQPIAAASPEQTAHNVLWRNNGNSTFTDISAETALGVPATGAGVVTTDFNNDRAIDFVLAGGATGASILLNPREGKFTPLAGIDFKKENLPPAVGVVAFDFDKDGWMDLAFTHAGAPGISLWRNVEGKRLERVALPDFGWTQGWGIAWLDYDNDGWLDLAAVGEGASGGEIRLLRNLGDAGWADVTKSVHLDSLKLKEPRSLAVADLKNDGSPDLVVTQASGETLVLQNIGANQNHWIQIDLKALNDNKSGIGTKLEIYAGPLYQKWEIAGASGYLGQSSPMLLAGLGKQKTTDVVRLLWPTGVPQDEVNLAAEKTQTIAELDRRGSSCPILFSWNGREYEFIADMIGPGVVGHWVA